MVFGRTGLQLPNLRNLKKKVVYTSIVAPVENHFSGMRHSLSYSCEELSDYFPPTRHRKMAPCRAPREKGLVYRPECYDGGVPF